MLRPDDDQTTFSIMMHIGHISTLVGRTTDAIAARFDLNQSDVRLLMAVKREQRGKPVRPSDLGERLNLSRATITYRVDRMIELGLAERDADPSDRRALYVKLTDKGEKTIAAVMDEYAILADARLAVVDALPGGRTALNAMLEALGREWGDAEPAGSAAAAEAVAS